MCGGSKKWTNGKRGLLSKVPKNDANNPVASRSAASIAVRPTRAGPFLKGQRWGREQCLLPVVTMSGRHFSRAGLRRSTTPTNLVVLDVWSSLESDDTRQNWISWQGHLEVKAWVGKCKRRRRRSTRWRTLKISLAWFSFLSLKLRLLQFAHALAMC